MLLGKKLLLVSGKGGIGKSLVSAALGEAAARAGQRVLLVGTAALDPLGPLFGQPPVRHADTELAPGLFAINLQAGDNFRDYIVKHLGQKRLFDKVISHRVVQSFISTIPGLAELMTLGRLFYECELAPEPRFETVIYDAPASGHFLSLMTTPDAVLASNVIGPVRSETERVKSFLRAPANAGILYVTVPEELVVSEALDFLPQLAAKAVAPLVGVVANRMPTPAPAPSPATGAPDDVVGAYLRTRHERAAAAFAALRRGLAGEPSLAGLPLWTLPDLGPVAEPLPPGFGAAWLAGPGGPLAGAHP